MTEFSDLYTAVYTRDELGGIDRPLAHNPLVDVVPGVRPNSIAVEGGAFGDEGKGRVVDEVCGLLIGTSGQRGRLPLEWRGQCRAYRDHRGAAAGPAPVALRRTVPRRDRGPGQGHGPPPRRPAGRNCRSARHRGRTARQPCAWMPRPSWPWIPTARWRTCSSAGPAAGKGPPDAASPRPMPTCCTAIRCARATWSRMTGRRAWATITTCTRP